MQPELNKQFKKALDAIENTKKSVFITGKAGTGKSTLLEYFCELGHNVENYILPIGCKATIDADKRYFSIDKKTVL